MENQIVSMGKLFPDGSAIDQLRAGQLVLWHEGHGQLGQTVEYDGKTYTPVTFDASLEHVHLPSGTEDFGNAEQLIADVREALTTWAGLEGDATLLAAVAIVGSWVAECLPGLLLINLWGPVDTEAVVLDIMGYLCRHALPVFDPSLHGLANLPAGLAPTLILRCPSERSLARLVAAAGEPDTYILFGAGVVHLHCPIVVSTRKPLRLPAVMIPLQAAGPAWHRITKCDGQNLVDRFQPQLLQYRLTRHLSVANSQFDVSGFCPEVRLLARVLGAVVDGSPRLQASIVAALSVLDEQHRTEQLPPPQAAVLEALLVLCHEKTPVAYVGQVTELANTLLENREENIQLAPGLVGDILRQQLGLVTRRRALGYEVALCVDTQRHVHRLAVAHDLLEHVAGCPSCDEMRQAIRTDNQPAAGA